MEGEVVVLEAVIISTPPPHEILWYHNGNGPLVDSNQWKIVQEGEDVFKLILLGVSGGSGSSGNGNNPVRHDGHYQIKATNIAGSVQSTCQIFVQSKPVQVISLSNVLCTLNRTTFLSVYEYLDKKLRYKDPMYFILKLLSWYKFALLNKNLLKNV